MKNTKNSKKIGKKSGSAQKGEQRRTTRKSSTSSLTGGELVRINKRIKDLGLASRRDADALIEKHKVLINGKVAKLGDKVSEKDKIELLSMTPGGREYLYYAFYKPKGVVSHSPQYDEQEVKDFFKNWDKDHLTIVGRLDKHSEGLMLVTNDKRLVERILDPKFGHERVYDVTVQEKLSNNIKNLFGRGFYVKDRFTAKPAKVEIIDNYNFRITLTEGKKHQIRLMTNELHYTVSKLKRTHIMNINLKGVEPGKAKPINKEEVAKLLKLVGLK